MIDHRESRIRAARRQHQFVTALRLSAHHGAILVPHLQVGLEVVGLSEIVDRGDVEQQVEREFGIVAQQARGLEQVFARDVDPIVALRCD